VPILCKLLRDRDCHVRYVAAGALGFGPSAKAAVVPLIAALRDGDRHVRCMAAYALGRIGPEAAEAVSALVVALTDEDEQVRWRAADALGYVGPRAKTAVGALLRALKEGEGEFLRRSAAIALGEIGADAGTVVPVLLAALADRASGVRAGAAAGLGGFGAQARAAVPALSDVLLDSDDYFVQKAACSALKKMGPEATGNVVPALTRALDSKSADVRCRAAAALSDLDDGGKSVAGLARLVHTDAPARQAAIRALGAMGPKARSAFPVLLAALKDKDEYVRDSAAAALERIDPEAAARHWAAEDRRAPK
jgi:HEAT repeat protein